VVGGRWQVVGGRWQVAGGRWQVAGCRVSSLHFHNRNFVGMLHNKNAFHIA
jgi:hypothetical protein